MRIYLHCLINLKIQHPKKPKLIFQLLVTLLLLIILFPIADEIEEDDIEGNKPLTLEEFR